jgi:hypothetical protein
MESKFGLLRCTEVQ